MKDGQRVILVTGANGFIGGHLVPVLERHGWIVRRAVRKLTAGDNDVLIDSIGPATGFRDDASRFGIDSFVVRRSTRTTVNSFDHPFVNVTIYNATQIAIMTRELR